MCSLKGIQQTPHSRAKDRDRNHGWRFLNKQPRGSCSLACWWGVSNFGVADLQDSL